jgi:hypothetical protein
VHFGDIALGYVYIPYGWLFEDTSTNVCICNPRGIFPRSNLSAFLIYPLVVAEEFKATVATVEVTVEKTVETRVY